jgi:hypothetical protein
VVLGDVEVEVELVVCGRECIAITAKVAALKQTFTCKRAGACEVGRVAGSCYDVRKVLSPPRENIIEM